MAAVRSPIRHRALFSAMLLAAAALLLGAGPSAEAQQQKAPAAAAAQPQAAPQGKDGGAPVQAGGAQEGQAPQPAPAEPQPQPQPQQPPPVVLSPADQQAIEDIRSPTVNLKTAVETLEKSVERNLENDEELGQLRVELVGLSDGAQLTLDTLRPKAAALRQQIDKLGPPPAKDAAPEAEQVANERARLNTLSAEFDGAIKTSELVQVRARQLNETVQSARQSLFAKQILKRSPSPLSSQTWKQVVSDIPGAGRQLGGSVSTWLNAAKQKWIEATSLLVGIVVLFLALTALMRRYFAYRLDTPREKPPGFFEQAAVIGWLAPMIALPSLSAIGLAAVGLDALDLFTYEVGQIAKTAFPALALFVAVSALTRAILSPRRPAWRAVDLSTPAARSLTRTITRIAAVFSADIILQEVIRRLYLPLSISIMEAALCSIAIAALLLQLVRTRFEPKSVTVGVTSPSGDPVAAASVEAPEPVARLNPYLIKLPTLVIALAILLLSLLGYIGLARFISTQVVVTGSAVAVVLVLHLAIRAMLGESDSGGFPLRRVLEQRVGLNSIQSGALTRTLSIMLNAALALLAMPLILVTWGYSAAEAIAWLKAAVFGFEIGELRISLARILIAVGLFLALVFATRLAQRWLDRDVLRSLRIDQGIANSIHTAVGYTGFIVAMLAAISYGGLDITNFAIVAGALSVGIGFGLQSIVNNFVSGLILLVERPIKVGDRVAIKGAEGFVRRISVRSTEIETFDKASLIVPNSELITSTVTNRTHRNALGTVEVKVGVSYQSDPDRVREVLQKVLSECELIMQHPVPSVSFTNFGESALEFAVGGTVADVSKALGVQSELRFRIFKAFKDADIELPYPQHDVHLRDLDVVRALVTRLGEERARQTEAASVSKDGRRDS